MSPFTVIVIVATVWPGLNVSVPRLGDVVGARRGRAVGGGVLHRDVLPARRREPQRERDRLRRRCCPRPRSPRR